MFGLLKTLWAKSIEKEIHIGNPASPPVTVRTPVETPAALEPPQPITKYVLPLRWSLSYALTEKQWSDVKERHKKIQSDWQRCPRCPKRCKSKPLDEAWRYDHATHTKIFIGAEFICEGCHWLKTTPWRIQTWLKGQAGVLPVLTKPPHIIHCLGWTQDKVNNLRNDDLKEHRALVLQLRLLDLEVKRGTAAKIPTPIERLSPIELAQYVKPGQVMIVPWKVDLSALTVYGYSLQEIESFERRMYDFAAKRMFSL